MTLRKSALTAIAATFASGAIADDSSSLHAQLITYELNGISQADYQTQMVQPDAPILAEVDGLISKIWIANEETRIYGGFYLWENEAAMTAFMQSDLVAAVASRPFVHNLASVDYSVNQDPSVITRGLQ